VTRDFKSPASTVPPLRRINKLAKNQSFPSPVELAAGCRFGCEVWRQCGAEAA